MFDQIQEWPKTPQARGDYVQDRLLDVLFSSDLLDVVLIGKSVTYAQQAAYQITSETELEPSIEIAQFFLEKILWCVDYYKARTLQEAFGLETLSLWSRELAVWPKDTKQRQEALDQNRRTNEVITKLLVEVEKNSITDILTGLHNRRHFEEMLNGMVDRSNRYENQGFSILLIDIDHFKFFNDKYGHQTGDDALRVVGELLRDALRKTDIAARFGGEEFACLLPLTAMAGAHIFAERLRKEIENFPFIVEIEDDLNDFRMSQTPVTVSIGVCEYQIGQRTVDLVEKVDLALYRAKALGRNRVELAE